MLYVVAVYICYVFATYTVRGLQRGYLCSILYEKENLVVLILCIGISCNILYIIMSDLHITSHALREVNF